MDSATRAYLDREKARTEARVNQIFEEGTKRQDGMFDWNAVKQDYLDGKVNTTTILNYENMEQQHLAEQASQAAASASKPKPPVSTGTDMVKGALAGIEKAGAESVKFLTESFSDYAKNINPLHPFDPTYALRKKYLPQTIDKKEAALGDFVNKNVIGSTPEVKPLSSMVTGSPVYTEGTGILGKTWEATDSWKKDLYQPQTTAGQVTGDIAGFLASVYSLGKLGIVKNPLTSVKGGLAASTIAGYAMMDPNDPRLINSLVELKPELRNTVIEGLMTDPNDPTWMNRVRGGAQELALGTAGEGVIKGAQWLYHLFKGDKKAIQSYVDSVNKVIEHDAPKPTTGETPIQQRINESTGAPSAERLPREQAQQAAQAKIDTQNRIVQAFKEGKVTKRSDLDGYIEVGADPVKNTQSWRAVKEATDHLENYVGQAVKQTGEVPFELSLQIAKSKPAFMRTAEDLVTLAEERRGLPDVTIEVPDNVGGSSRALTTESTAVNKIVAKVDKAKPGKTVITADERKTLVNTFVDQVERLNKTVKTSDFPSLYMDGTLNPDRTINFGNLAANRGLTQQELINFIKNATIGGTKQEVAASVAGALIGVSGAANAEDGSADMSTADKLLTAAIFALAGRHAYKLMSKGTKILQREAAPEAENAFVKSYTEEAAKLPKNISPMVTPVKTLPRIRPDDLTSAAERLAKGDHKGAAQVVEDSGFNLDNIDSDQDIQDVIAQFSDMFSSQAGKAAGGVQTHAETQALAEEIGTSMDDLMQLYKNDTAGLAAKVTANRVLLAASSKRVSDLADVALNATFEARPAALVSLRKQVLIHANIQNAMKGVQTEIGRALQAFRIKAYGDDLVVNKLDELLEGMGGRQLNETFAKEISDVFKHNPADANRFVRDAATATKTDMVKAYWYSSVLSGVSTHVTNITSNLLKVVEGGFEHAMAIRLGKALGTKGAEHYKASDMLTGMMLGNKVALGLVGREYEEFSVSTVKKAFLENMPVLDAANSMKIDGQVANPMQFAISSSAQGVKADTTYGRILDMAGKYVISVPQRALVAEDEFFKSVNYYGNLYMEAAARGRSKGLAGEELNKFVSDMMVSPDGDLMENAMRVAREGTFTSNLGEFGQATQQWLSKVPGSFLIMPFVRVTANIMKSAAERIPLFDRLPYIGKIADNNRVMWEAGGMQRNLVMAKYATGTVYLTSAYELASNGMLTGGQLFETRKDAENLAGVQNYSLKFGDTYYGINRMSPFGWYFSFVADWYNYSSSMTAQEQKGYVEAGMTIMTKFLESQTFLRGISNIVTAVHESSQPNSNGKAFDMYLGKTLGSFYPSLFASVNGAYVDPEVKEFWEWSDPIKARIVGMSDEVYGKRNIFGQVQTYEGGLGIDMASPVMTRSENPSPAAQEIYRLNVDIQKPPKRIGNVDLTAKQYDDYMALFADTRIGGKNLEEALNDRISKADWQGLSERQGDYGGRKEQIIRNTYKRYNHQVKRSFMQKYPDLTKMILQDKQNKRNALGGLPIFDLANQSPYEDADE